METYCDACYPAHLAPHLGLGLQTIIFYVENAKSSCGSCQILCKTLKHFYPKSESLKVTLYPKDFGEATASFHVHGPEEENESRIVYYVRAQPEIQAVAQSVGKFFRSVYVHRDLEELPSGKASLQQILAWDTACFSNHANCWSSQSKPLLPARVVDIGMGNGRCRLYESAEQHENYITLSHCWGEGNILTTKKQNLKRHKENIDFKLLPKTFQDSINITRHLGIRYLWIDSLCIVQDDPDDWAEESSKMAYIYRSSYLTITATAAKNDSEGLFKPREVNTFCIEISEPQSSGQPTALRARRGRKHNCLQIMDTDNYRNEDSEPLMERAWVYQERLLSRRLLHFASDEMIWECRQASECECDLLHRTELRKLIWERQGEMDDTMSDRSMFEELLSGKERETEFKTQRWYQLIQNYTSLDITKDEDRLPAFSGIASTIVDAQDYMAGIRKNHAVRDLLWFSLSTINCRRSQSYLAPTWSWSSLIGAVGHTTSSYHSSVWNLPESRILIDVNDIATVRSTVDLFGRVKAAELKVRGYCLDARLLERDGQDLTTLSWGSHRLRMEIPLVADMTWPYDLAIDTAEDVQLTVGSAVSLLAIWSTKTRVNLLILVEQYPFPRRRFRRIGMVRISLYDMAAGEMTTVSVEDLLHRSKAQLTDIVII